MSASRTLFTFTMKHPLWHRNVMQTLKTRAWTTITDMKIHRLQTCRKWAGLEQTREHRERHHSMVHLCQVYMYQYHAQRYDGKDTWQMGRLILVIADGAVLMIFYLCLIFLLLWTCAIFRKINKAMFLEEFCIQFKNYTLKRCTAINVLLLNNKQ